MAKRKQRIVVTVVSAESSWTMTIAEGAELANGKLAGPPSKKQFEIAYKAIADLSEAE